MEILNRRLFLIGGIVMNAVFWTIFFIFLFAFLLVIDLKLGWYYYVKKGRDHSFPERNSDFTLFTEGESLYEDLFQSIRNSKRSIHILFFIVRNDDISDTFYSLLKEKATDGVEVKLLLDYMGSIRLKRKTIKELKQSGVAVAHSRKPTFPFFFYTVQSRNHRKIAILDGQVGYIGGFNIGKEYIGHNPKLGFWRDYHLKCEGEGVQDLQTQFLDDWYESTGKDLRKDVHYFPPLYKGNVLHRFVPTYGNQLEKHFISFIQKAQKELYICSPYFIPNKNIRDELILALKRGVTITIMVPIKSDHPFVKEASFPYFGPLLKFGANIYQYDIGFYHAKVIVVDNNFCDIGTANFDKRSLYFNDEINCFMHSPSFIQLIKGVIHYDLKNTRKLTIERYQQYRRKHRGKIKLATIFSPFL